MAQPTMTPEEFKQAQRALGLTDAQMSAMLGMENPDNLRRFKVMKPDANSARVVKPWHVRLLKAYLAGYRPDDWPA
jgi:hypothetical protein